VKEVLTIVYLTLMSVLISMLIDGLMTMYIKEQIRIDWEENDRQVREFFEKEEVKKGLL
jgi:NhaP-type Na+/H+ or K+/H+ antiporter